MTFSIPSLALVLAGAVVSLLLIWYKPVWSILAAISITSLLDCFGVGSAVGSTSAGAGVNIYTDDVACLVLLTAGVIVFLRYPRSLSRDLVPCFLLISLMVVNMGRGVFTFGVKQAGNDARDILTFVTPAIAIMSLRPILRLNPNRLAQWFGLAGLCLCAIAVLRWTGVLAMPEAYVILDQEELRQIVRALPSDYAIIVGQAFLAAIYVLVVHRRNVWWWWAGAGMFGVMTLALQHRSVWTATGAGLGWLVFRTVRISPGRWFAFGGVALVAMGLTMVADPAVLTSAGELLSGGLSETQSKHSTWAWRVDGYVEATNRVLDSSAVDMIVGPPAGWSANAGGHFASRHIHSRYVVTLASYGFLGTFVLLIWFGMLVRRCQHRSIRRQTLPRSSGALVQALLVSELIYLIPYFGGLLQGAVLGLLWIPATQRAVQTVGRCFEPVYRRAQRLTPPAVVTIQ